MRLRVYSGAMDQIARNALQLGAILRRRRKALGRSQADVGQQINARQATLSSLEAGAVDARLSTLLDALAALDLELVVRPRTSGDPAEIEALF